MSGLDTSVTDLPWHKRVQWVPASTLVIIPTLGLISTSWVTLRWQTALFTYCYVILTGVCITGGYHRLWSHKSYSASTPLRLFLATFGAAAMEGPIRWWAREHRAHHRYTDTDEDPYNIKLGFFHAHILWMIFRQPPRQRHIDISDLRTDAVVAWQYKYYPLLALIMGWVFPAIFAGLIWQDWLGGFLYGGILRMVIVHHITFCTNSLAHTIGDQPYDDRTTPRNNLFAAFLTLGEGYHNFHHEFPSDYRNGVKWYQLDFTKWCIMMWKLVGLASDLKCFRHPEIEKAELQQAQKTLKLKESTFDWGQPLADLPVIEWSEYQVQVQDGKGRALVCVEGAIHDVTDFIDEHPGGKQLIRSFVGKDATAVFNGGLYNHSKVARNILAINRVAVVRGGGEVEAWK